MSTFGRVLAFDPAVNGDAGKILRETGAGGGNISGAGTYYSLPSETDRPGTVSECVDKTGTLAGTLSVEVSNDTEDDDRNGTSKWSAHPAMTGIPAISSGSQNFAIEDVSIAFARWRLKFVYSSGSGTFRSRRVVKGN